MEKNTIIIFTANKARELLKDGFKGLILNPTKQIQMEREAYLYLNMQMEF